MKSRDEVIGSVVERVIPEGWHVLRNSQAQSLDLMECSGLWVPVGSFAGHPVSADGRVGGSLVIRRNAPAEDVAKLKATIAERDETIRWYKQLEASSKARIAELELAVARSKGEIDALRGDRDLYKKRHGELTVKINAVKKAWEGA